MTAIAMILLKRLYIIGPSVGVLGEWLLWIAGILTFVTVYQYFEKGLDYIYTVENNKKNPLVRLYGFEETEGVPERVLATLKNEPDIRGLYSVSARCTLYLAQAVEKLGVKGKVHLIGSDLYPESVRYLKEGIIDIIIHKNPHYQVTVGLKHLLTYLTRREEPALKDERLTSVIVCRSNVDKYLH